QEQRRSAVLGALGPIALGHAASVAAVVAVVSAAQTVVDAQLLRYAGAGALIAFGIYKLLAPLSHPRWVGMRVDGRGLATWSFLMATAHGAGLMLLPVMGRLAPADAAHASHSHSEHARHIAEASVGPLLPNGDLLVVGVHTAAMLLAMAAVALLVYEKLGVAILRRTWLNLDLIWAGALVAAGAISLVA
ncbi:MAG: hypothetical protein DIU80_022030, partial [Chloroflexota bacterium]